MRTKLLKKIRKKYSYVWSLETTNRYVTTDINGIEKEVHLTQLTLVVANNKTKKAEMCIQDSYPGAITIFLSRVIDSGLYIYLKNAQSDKKKERLYRRLLKKKESLRPYIINDKTIKLSN